MKPVKTIAVIFGGRSTEHDVSIVTAISSIIKPLELSRQYKVEPIYISKDGSWYWDQKLKDITLYQGGGIEDFVQRAPKVHFLFDDGLVLVKSSQFAGRKMYKKIDVVFPAMHGTHGEDGELMGVLEMAGVPYVGCGVAASAIAMDKVLAKQVTQSAGLPSTPWTWCYTSDFSKDPTAILKQIEKLKYPLFVKPAHLGSSIGISKVDSKDGLMNALEVAAHYDDKIIVEQGVQNLIEVTLPVMGNEEPIPSLLERPKAGERTLHCDRDGTPDYKGGDYDQTHNIYDCDLARRRDRPLLGSDADFSPGGRSRDGQRYRCCRDRGAERHAIL